MPSETPAKYERDFNIQHKFGYLILLDRSHNMAWRIQSQALDFVYYYQCAYNRSTQILASI